jgi:hypothetical protein
MHNLAQIIGAMLLRPSAQTGSYLGPAYALGGRCALPLLADRRLVGDHLPVLARSCLVESRSRR